MPAENEDLNKFQEHFPHEGDQTIQLLKAHLLVEELVREIFELQLSHSKALRGNNGISLSCHQIICLVEAITPQSQACPWIWIASKKLNNIRNDLAHKLTPHGLEEKVKNLIEYVHENSPVIKQEIKNLNIETDNKFLEIIVPMLANLSSLKNAIKSHKNAIKDAFSDQES